MTVKWPVVRLGEVCDIVSGATPKTNDPSLWDGDICWATPKDLSELVGKFIRDTPRKLTKKGLHSCSAGVLPAGSVLLSSRAPIGLVAINTVPMATNQGFKSLVPHPDQVDAGYLYRWLDGNRRYIKSLGRGATFAEISKTIAAEISLPLPPLEEQRRIAAVMDRADGLRLTRNESVSCVRELERAVFDEFLREASDWERLPLANVVEYVTVGHVGPTSDHFAQKGVPFIRTGNVGDGEIIRRDLRCITAEFHRTLKKSTLQSGDLLISRVVSDEVRSAIVPPDLDGANCANVIVVRPGRAVTPTYLQMLIRLPESQTALLGRRVGSAQSVVNTRVLQQWIIPVPTTDGLELVDRRLARVRAVAERVRRSVTELDSLFEALQYRAFAGQL